MTNRRKKSTRPLSDVERWRNLCNALADDSLADDPKTDFLAGLGIGVAPALLFAAREQRTAAPPDEKLQGENIHGNTTPGSPDDSNPEAPKQ